jgi:hypothetical protein
LNIKRVLAGIGTVALAIGLAGGLASSAQASALPVVYGVPYAYGATHPGSSNFVDGKVRPTGLLVWTGDGSGWFVIHSYSSWSNSNAWASATVHVRSCWESCFQHQTENTTLHFYRIRTHDGHPYFTRLYFSLRYKVAGLGSSTLDFYSHGTPAWYY